MNNRQVIKDNEKDKENKDGKNKKSNKNVYNKYRYLRLTEIRDEYNQELFSLKC